MHTRRQASRRRPTELRSHHDPATQPTRHSRSNGEPLPAGVRSRLEPRFGHSFEQVRVHADAPAGAMLEPLGAMAATVDGEIFVRPDRYAPDTPPGRYLLAHELAHVVQGRTHGVDQSLAVSPPGHASEREAGAAADAVMAGFAAPALSAAAAPVAPMFAQTPLMGLDHPWPEPLMPPVPPAMGWPPAPWLPAPVIMGGGAIGGGGGGTGGVLEKLGQGVQGGGASAAEAMSGLAGGITDAGKAAWDFLTGW